MQKTTNNTIQAMWVGIGSLCSFLFTIISAAILSRFLSKSDYGTYKQVMFVYQTLLAVFTLGLPKAYGYFLPKVQKKEGFHVVGKLNNCFFCLGGVFSLLLYFSASLIASALKNKELEECLKIFSPAPLFLLPTMGLEGLMATYRKTRLIAVYTVTTRIFMLVCIAFPVAFYRANVHIALWGFTISSFLSCLLALYMKKIPFNGIAKIKSSITYKQIFSFSLPLMVASIWAIVIKSADQFFVSRWFGQEVFAEFSNGSIELPFVQMVLGAGSVVLLPLFSKYISESLSDKKEILNIWMRASEKSILIIYPLVIYCWVFAPLIMTFLYGNSYEISAVYFRIMLIVNFFTIAQYYPIIVALGATKYYANAHLFTAVLIWILNYICINIYPSPYLVTAISVFCHLLKIYLMLRFISNYMCIKTYNLFPIKQMIKIALTCSISALFIYWLQNILLINNMLFTLCYTFLMYGVLVIISGKLFSVDYFEIIKPIINKIKR